MDYRTPKKYSILFFFTLATDWLEELIGYDLISKIPVFTMYSKEKDGFMVTIRPLITFYSLTQLQILERCTSRFGSASF